MEPVLNGDPDSGDKVLVNKLAFRVAQPRRWQVVVFDRPGDAEPYVKRLIGLPCEEVRIEDGDVLIDGEVPPRDDAVLEEMLVDVFRTPVAAVDFQRFWETDGPPGSWAADEGGITFGGGPGTVASIRSRHDVTDSAADAAAGAAPGEALSPVNDLVVSVEAEFLSGDAGHFRIAVHRGSAEAVWLEVEPRGAIRLRRGDALLDSFEPALTGLVPGTPFHIAISTVDRRVRVVAGGVELVRRSERDEPGVRKRAGFERRNNRVTLTATDAKVRLSSLAVRRDVYYSADGETGVSSPFRLGPEEYFLLGDNSRVSKDSRYWSHPVRRGQLVGTAFMIVWPPGRIRMLP
jgi:signal peptidase I